MGRNLMVQIANYLSKQRRRKLGYWILRSLGAVVVFCTTYALILPAITMSNEPICGMEAHVHDETCWTLTAVPGEIQLICADELEADVVFHAHSDLCYDGEGRLICPLEEREQHVHDENCFVEQRTLICELEGVEVEDGVLDAGAAGQDMTAPVSQPDSRTEPQMAFVPGHTHTAACYTTRPGDLICGLEETAGHVHDDVFCYENVPTGEPVLVCPIPDTDVVDPDTGEIIPSLHQHTGECYQQWTEHVLTCTIEESEGHTHSEACYSQERILTCGLKESEGAWKPAETFAEPPRTSEEQPEDVHVHTEACYEIAPRQICTEEELELHVHGPECYEIIQKTDEMGEIVEETEVLICELPVVIEHEHDGACVLETESDGQREMVFTCELPEHTHTDECFVPLGPDPDPHKCGLSEHAHTEDCYFESGELRCTVPEHTHTEECFDADNFEDPKYQLDAPAEKYWRLLDVNGEPVLDENGYPVWVDANGSRILTDEYGDPVLDEDGNPIFGRDDFLTAENPAESIVFDNASYEFETDDFDVTLQVTGVATLAEEDETDTPAFGDEQGLLQQFPGTRADYHPTANPPAVDDHPPVYTPAAEEPVIDEPASPEEEDLSDEDVFLDDLDDEELESRDGRLLSFGDWNPFSWLTGNKDDNSENSDGIENSANTAAGLPLPPMEENKISGSQLDGWQYGISGESQAEPRWTWEDVIFRLEIVDPAEDESAQALLEQAESDDLGGERLMLQVMQLKAYVPDDGGRELELDLSRCEITLTLQPKAELVEQLVEEALQSMEDEPQTSPVAQPEPEIGEDVMAYAAAIVNNAHPVMLYSGNFGETGTDGAEPGSGGDTEPAGPAEDPDGDGDTDTPETAGTEDGTEEEDTLIITYIDSTGQREIQEIPLSQSTQIKVAPFVGTYSGAGGIRLLMAADKNSYNPAFTVEYLAWTDRVKRYTAAEKEKMTSDTFLEVIDTDGKGLPKNEKDADMPLVYLKLDTKTKTIMRQENEPDVVYLPEDYTYAEAPGLQYINVFTGIFSDEEDGTKKENLEIGNYLLNTIRIIRDGSSTDYTLYKRSATGITEKPDNYDDILAALHFTNKPETDTKNASNKAYKTGQTEDYYIQIKDGDTIQLICEQTKAEMVSFDGYFFDYDISAGIGAKEVMDSDTFTMKTNIDNVAQGINSPGNYKGKSTDVKYAFGNANTGTGLHTQVLEKLGAINKWNGSNHDGVENGWGYDVWMGCTFGIAANELTKDGQFQFASGIQGPQNLFTYDGNAQNAIGKHDYEGSLTFRRNGDTYTLTNVDIAGAGSAGELEKFSNPNNENDAIWTNNFWPMDKAPKSNRADPLFGKSGISGDVAGKAGTATQKRTKASNKADDGDWLPESVDGINHNSNFGMTFEIGFNLDKTYKGALEYYFFGDDDLWVYLDGELICDIGGVHSPAGEYVNLRNYVAPDSGDHTLAFFYTERGASGSTCWMQFTLPSVTIRPPRQTTRSLKIAKDVDGEPADPDQEFLFTLKLWQGSGDNKSPLKDDYKYIRYNSKGVAYEGADYGGTGDKNLVYDKDGNILLDHDRVFYGSMFKLKAGDYIVIQNLPLNTSYSVVEAPVDGYQPTYATSSGKAGMVEGGETVFIFSSADTLTITNHTMYALPETGGPSAMTYTTGGAALILAAGGLLYSKRSRKRRDGHRT